MNIDIDQIKAIVLTAGKIIKERSAVDRITEKGTADFVTGVDFSVQEFVQDNLKRMYPHIACLSEEQDNQKIEMDQYVWILDPVDGTTNLIHDYKASAISLALSFEQEVLLGIIYDPFLEELFIAQKGKGSYLNGKAIQVSQVKEIKNSLIAIGTTPYDKSLAEQNFNVFKQLFMDVQDIRRSGSAALDFAHVACGRIEGYFERHLRVWDYAAGLLIIKEAGGKITNDKGEELTLENKCDVVAGNKHIQPLLYRNYLPVEG